MEPILLALATAAALPWALAAAHRVRRAGAAAPSYDPSPGERYAHLWGYQDTRFEFLDRRTVRVTGDRYPVAGRPLPRLVPFIEEVLGVSIEPGGQRSAAPAPTPPAPLRNEPFLAELEGHLAPRQWTAADDERLVHSHGQLSVDEVYRITGGGLPDRVVDLVVYPEAENDVVELVRLAERHGVALIPYGGGTNVSGALACPADERRMVVSVDMRRMRRILEIDRDNNRAVVEAGITGKDLEVELARHGLTCGHEPDSVELSTLGGWIATNASGMKKNRYGNIEDIVLEAVLVTPRGEVRSLPAAPRSSLGVQPRHLLFGSEGSLGIITRAVLQVCPLPEVRRFASFVFPSFGEGVAYLKAAQAAGLRPASIRLVNNTELRLGRALAPEPTAGQALVSRIKELYVLRWRRFEPLRMAACTVLMEGTAAEVRQQERALARLAARAGGLAGGAEGGRRGYQLTFAIAYIRDFLNQFAILGETFETSAPWSRIQPICAAVEREMRRLCEAEGVPGRPYLSYRISQTYHTGVCIYFTMGFCGRGLDEPERVYDRIEHRLREVILEEGGSLSHHHGVGKVRRPFIGRVHTPASIEGLRHLKRGLDPHNVFAAANNVFGPEVADEDAGEVRRDVDGSQGS